MKSRRFNPRNVLRPPIELKTVRWRGLEAAYTDGEQQIALGFADAAKAGDEVAKRELEFFHELKAVFPGGVLSEGRHV